MIDKPVNSIKIIDIRIELEQIHESMQRIQERNKRAQKKYRHVIDE